MASPVALPRTLAAPRPARLVDSADRRPQLSARQLRVLTPVFLISVLALPLQVPRFSYNLAPADLPVLLFVVLAAASFWRSRVRLRLPLTAGAVMMLLGGSLAITQSVVPRESTSSIAQDIYLFAWFLLAVNFIARAPERLVRRAAVAWTLVGTAVGAFTWAVTLRCPESIPVVFGHKTATDFCRASGTLFDENLAGYYLAVSLFIAWASPWPRGRFGKAVITVPMVLGIYVTQSITALIVTAAGVLVTAAVSFVSRRQAAAAVTLLVLALAISAVAALPPDIERRPSGVLQSLGQAEPLQGSLGRSESSFEVRSRRWQEALHFFGSSVLIGIGPASTDDALLAAGAPIGGELQNDYVAGFLERGLVGGLGVLLLFGAAAAWTMRVAIDDQLRRRGWRPPAFAGAMIAALLAAFTLEILHFRHQWLAFALIVGLGLRQELGADDTR